MSSIDPSKFPPIDPSKVHMVTLGLRRPSENKSIKKCFCKNDVLPTQEQSIFLDRFVHKECNLKVQGFVSLKSDIGSRLCTFIVNPLNRRQLTLELMNRVIGKTEKICINIIEYINENGKDAFDAIVNANKEVIFELWHKAQFPSSTSSTYFELSPVIAYRPTDSMPPSTAAVAPLPSSRARTGAGLLPSHSATLKTSLLMRSSLTSTRMMMAAAAALLSESPMPLTAETPPRRGSSMITPYMPLSGIPRASVSAPTATPAAAAPSPEPAAGGLPRMSVSSDSDTPTPSTTPPLPSASVSGISRVMLQMQQKRIRFT